ncbi:uncharacterized protein LOC143206831 [Rhynchophorus ferrugineus]|uniref:Thymidylate kinase n=1 Tax=Rhynchophorus ferrugineus TaxID=354439 RepID=A0A834HRX1_RHYFE|nr:hypothetical protein GWI33_020094 [Rhynchophorus ferrugineus]
MSKIKRGALIVIEGVDRSGKSTQCKKLVDTLLKNKIPAVLMNFPDRTTVIGRLINEYLTNKKCKLNDQAIHLLFSANRWENVEKMKSLLNNGTTLIVDRYSYSGIAFSSSKKDMSTEWCKAPENGLIKPDLVFLLKLSQEEAARRTGFGDERYENTEMQEKVSNIYSAFAKEEDNWQVIDASGTVDEVHNELFATIVKKITEVSDLPLQQLHF